MEVRGGAQGILETPVRRGRPRRKFTDGQLLELYGEGLNDAEVGRRLGVSRSAVRYHRLRLGLPPNQRVDAERVRLLHSQGLNDGQMAEKLGVHRATVCYWRLKLGLESNWRPARPRPRAPRKRAPPRVSVEGIRLLNAQGLNDTQIAERLGIPAETVGRWRRRLGIPAARWVRMARTEGEILDLVRSEGAVQLRTLLQRVRGSARYVKRRVREVISRGEVGAVRLRLRGMRDVVLYRDEEALAEYLGERLDLSPDLPRGRKASLTHRLRWQLPREVFERVHGLYVRERR